jgi:hypothetical protein
MERPRERRGRAPGQIADTGRAMSEENVKLVREAFEASQGAT